MIKKHSLLIATGNPDKLIEIKDLLAGLKVEILSLKDFPELPEVIEDQDSIEGNAMKKAYEIAQATGHFCLADDTGLFIEALDGAPGVFAARYAGEECSYADNRTKLLKEMDGKRNRKAEFRTAIALASPRGIMSVQEGRVAGLITDEERGAEGFGYDSIFEIEALGKTYAELELETKNKLSHRGLALMQMLPVLQDLYK
ncbi:MAG: RdgB/HAM1 family non-canonical purine NTP pyrophosphatase [Candidatus Cloacimonetes bacterium]|nr:RdgB/HAM1 family non-canonical purine NTP pyrophosphatase [Candidatus Cloacimonadota bacterium]